MGLILDFVVGTSVFSTAILVFIYMFVNNLMRHP